MNRRIYIDPATLNLGDIEAACVAADADDVTTMVAEFTPLDVQVGTSHGKMYLTTVTDADGWTHMEWKVVFIERCPAWHYGSLSSRCVLDAGHDGQHSSPGWSETPEEHARRMWS